MKKRIYYNMENEKKDLTFTGEVIIITLFTIGVSAFIGPWFLLVGIFIILARLYEHWKE